MKKPLQLTALFLAFFGAHPAQAQPDYKIHAVAAISEKMENKYQRDLLFCAATLAGEARGEGNSGMQAVMNVIQNRQKSGVRWWKTQIGDNVPDDTLAAVCVDPWQFSCWNDGTRDGQKKDPNFDLCARLADPDKFTENLEYDYFTRALSLAALALHGNLPDITHGSMHYHARGISPKWARRKTPIIALKSHLFYNNV